MTKAGKSRKLAKPAAMGRPAAVANAEQEILIKLEFICTDTGETSKYEVPADVDALKDLWSRTLPVSSATYFSSCVSLFSRQIWRQCACDQRPDRCVLGCDANLVRSGRHCGARGDRRP